MNDERILREGKKLDPVEACKMLMEELRLQTFRLAWISKHVVMIEEHARSGKLETILHYTDNDELDCSITADGFASSNYKTFLQLIDGAMSLTAKRPQ